MRLLPREQKERLQQLPTILQKIKQGAIVYLDEPCDCGSHIRHNDGGNYHARIQIAYDDGRYYVKEGSTCRLLPPPEWEEATEDYVKRLIEEALKEDWDVYTDREVD